MPGANGRSLAAAAFKQVRRQAGADAEFRAEGACAREIIGIEDSADADDGVGDFRNDGFRRGDRGVGAQRHFQRAHAARHQRLCQRHRVLHLLDGQDGDDDGLFEQGGNSLLFW